MGFSIKRLHWRWWFEIVLLAYAVVPYFWSMMMFTVGQRTASSASNGLATMGAGAESGYQKASGTRAANEAKSATWRGTKQLGTTAISKARGK